MTTLAAEPIAFQPMSPSDLVSDSNSSEPARERLDETELTRLRGKVDAGEALDSGSEEAALYAEMDRATAAIQPAATVLAQAADTQARKLGYDLDYLQLEELWAADPGLRAVKKVYDRERARWRRANGIVQESILLRDGESVELERRAPYRVEARSPRRRRRFPLRRG